jgi:hypothetical protein
VHEVLLLQVMRAPILGPAAEMMNADSENASAMTRSSSGSVRAAKARSMASKALLRRVSCSPTSANV